MSRLHRPLPTKLQLADAVTNGVVGARLAGTRRGGVLFVAMPMRSAVVGAACRAPTKQRAVCANGVRCGIATPARR